MRIVKSVQNVETDRLEKRKISLVRENFLGCLENQTQNPGVRLFIDAKFAICYVGHCNQITKGVRPILGFH